jgi:hypothetical protein
MYFIYWINESLFSVCFMEPVTFVTGSTRVIIHFPKNYSLYELVTADDLLEVSRARNAKQKSKMM